MSVKRYTCQSNRVRPEILRQKQGFMCPTVGEKKFIWPVLKEGYLQIEESANDNPNAGLPPY